LLVSPFEVIIELVERKAPREERMEEFVVEALASDRAIEFGEDVHAAADVHARLERLASGARAARPRPSHG
jgi:hypothetical protein